MKLPQTVYLDVCVCQEMMDCDAEKALWSWLPEAEICLPIHNRNVSNYKKVYCVFTPFSAVTLT